MLKVNRTSGVTSTATRQGRKAPKNKGGFGGGLGYITASALAGIGSIAEGAIDIVGAAGNLVVGNVEGAKDMFRNNVVGDWYEDVRSEYNPGGAMSFIGDVAHGLGQSATLFIPAAGVPLFYTGIASQGISGAAEKTGDVGFKEIAYGATSAAIEGVVDKALGGTATAIGNAVKGVGKGASRAGKTIFKATTDATRKGLAKTVLSSAAGEFGEEFISEYADTILQRLYKIDPNASTSLKDAIYAGAVGAVSGAFSTSVATVPRSINYHSKGESIIKRGNSQTLVNTATKVADRLAAKGTSFKDAAEWVTALRGQVDAYNDLVKKGKGESASAKTILGEMQAYLYFAETKAAHAGITDRIMNASEEDRAALAEYINMTVKESDRPKTYTAEDVAKNTDEIASQLAIMEFAGVALNYDAIRSDAEYEQEIASVIAEERNKGAAEGQSETSIPTNDGTEMSPEFAAAAARAETVAQTVDETVAPAVAQTVAEAPQRKMLKVDRKSGNVTRVEDITTNENLRQDAKDIETGAVEIDDDAERIKGDVKRAVGKITVDGAIYELSEKHLDEISRGVQKYLRQGMSEDEAVTRAVNERLVDIKELGEGGKITHQVGKNRLAKIKGAIINEYKRELQSRAKKGAEAEKSVESVAESGEAESVAEGKNRGETAKKSSVREEKNSESANKSTEGKNDAPKISEPKEILNEAQRAERARKRAERIIEWEKENAPSVKELNRARSLVKGFDNLSPEKRQSIIRMIRSAQGVDEKIVKGVANLMAIKAGADLEVRFDDQVGEYGMSATIGDKTLILVSSMADYKDTVKGTVAHELVHYLEKKPGYKTFADYVMKSAKPEAKAKVEKDITDRYNEHYRAEYEAEYAKRGLKGAELESAVNAALESEEHKALIESEVVAELVGKALNNEKFLARYARRGNTDGFIKKAWSFLKGIVQELKSKGDENNELADIIMPTIKSMDRLLQMGNVGESKRQKRYSLADSNAKSETKETENAEELSDNEGEKKAEELSDNEGEKKADDKSEEKKRAEELEAKKEIEAMFQGKIRMYSVAEFERIFDRIKNIPSETLGELLKDNGARIRGKDLGRIVRDVQLAMYKASFDGDVGATDAIKNIAEKAASIYVSQQTVFDEETKRYISLKKYIEDPEALKSYEDTLSEELFKEFANAGKTLSNYRDSAFIQSKLAEVKKKYFDYKEYTEYSKRASANASDLRKLADMQKRAAADEGIRNLAKAIGSTVNSHGAIRWTKIDAVLAQVSDFYNVDNAKIFGDDVTKMTLTKYAQVFDKEARSKIDRLLDLRKDRVGKPLTGTEMGLWADITGALRATINEYNGLYKDGKFFDRTKVANELAKSIVEYFGFGKETKYKNKFLEGLTKSALSLKEQYFYSVLSPKTVIEGLEGYSHNGVLKSFYQSIQSATELKDKMVAELIIPFDEFLDSKDNRWEDDKGISHRYRKKLVKKKVELFGTELYLGEAIYAFELCKREHAEAGLSKSGIKIYGEDGRQRAHIKEIDVELAKQELYKQFDETDKEYIEMVEKFFNETSTRIKRDADYEYLGYTNVLSGHYVPIIRDRFAQDKQTTDIRFSIRDVTTIYNEKFNQHITKNAKACEVINIQQLVSAHARGLADYANLYMPLKSFDRLYNSAVVLDDRRTTTIRELLNDVWPKSQDYFRDLFGDIQGIQRPTGGFDTIEKLGQKITSGFAPSVLSANPSVILSQTSSYISAAYDIDPKYLVKSLAAIGPRMKEIGERADKFSKIILARSFEEGAIKAQSNVQKINNVGKFLGKGLEFTDRQVCLLIFHAAEIQAESEGFGAIGTENNSKKAAEIADKTIQDTQAMSTPTERSAWMRSPNLLARAVTLFTSDPMKQLSHLYSNVAKYTAHKKRVKMGDTSYEADLKQDLKDIGRSSATIIVNSAYLAAIAWLIRWAFNSDEDEPKEEMQNVFGDFAGNVIGIMPLVSDVYDLAIHDYSITPTSVDILNDTVTNTRDFLSMNIDLTFKNEYVSRKEFWKTWKNFAKTITTFAGFPLDPILKTGSGIIRRFSPSAIYWYDSALSYNTYREDIDRAIAIGDEKLAQAAIEMKYQQEATGTISDAEIAEILRLYQLKDENGKYRTEVLPSVIPDEITTRKEKAKFESVYGEASGTVARLINSLEYKNLTDEERIRAIKNTYKLYFDKAKTEVLGEKITSAQAYAIILDDTSNLFLAQARKSSLEPKKDKGGKEISIKDQLTEYLAELEVEDTERLIIEYALGYKSKKNKAKFIAYINSLNLSEEEKKQIAERLGFEIKNGIVVEKTEE